MDKIELYKQLYLSNKIELMLYLLLDRKNNSEMVKTIILKTFGNYNVFFKKVFYLDFILVIQIVLNFVDDFYNNKQEILKIPQLLEYINEKIKYNFKNKNIDELLEIYFFIYLILLKQKPSLEKLTEISVLYNLKSKINSLNTNICSLDVSYNLNKMEILVGISDFIYREEYPYKVSEVFLLGEEVILSKEENILNKKKTVNNPKQTGDFVEKIIKGHNVRYYVETNAYYVDNEEIPSIEYYYYIANCKLKNKERENQIQREPIDRFKNIKEIVMGYEYSSKKEKEEFINKFDEQKCIEKYRNLFKNNIIKEINTSDLVVLLDNNKPLCAGFIDFTWLVNDVKHICLLSKTKYYFSDKNIGILNLYLKAYFSSYDEFLQRGFILHFSEESSHLIPLRYNEKLNLELMEKYEDNR